MVNRVARDLVELDAMHGLAGDVARQGFFQVPRDRLAFAVGVGRQVKLGSFLGVLTQSAHHVLLFFGDDVARLEIVLHVHAQAIGGQVADVADGGFDHITPAEEFAHRARLGRRFDDHQLSPFSLREAGRRAGDEGLRRA